MVIPFYGIMMHEIDKIIANPNNEVFILSCDGILRNCFVNNTTDRSLCEVCKFARNVGENSYKGRVKTLRIGNFANINEIQFPEFAYENIVDIQNIVYKNCYIGYGALSSYVSYTRNQEPVMDTEFRKYFNDLLASEIILITAMENLLDEINFDEVFLYNGRWADVRPVFDICKNRNINVNVLESVNNGTTSFDREIYVNVLPQDIHYRDQIINRIWEESCLDPQVKEEQASAFYKKRKNADFVRGDIKVFTADQQAEKLPDNWDTSKRNIVIFNSSEDEFIALGAEWEQYRIFKSQESGISELLTEFINNNEFHFYLRIHPNLIKVPYGYHKRLSDLENEFRNVTVIPGDSPVSTYKLIDQSEKVIVFGSTVGAEACYWRKPVILLGGTTYYLQNVAYIPADLAETTTLISRNSLEPKPITGALKYGFYLLNHQLYSETIKNEPYPIKFFGKTFGYGFKHMQIWNSALLFKVFYKLYISFVRLKNLLKNNHNTVPAKGY
ncbi:hypothetical protein [Ferruginibacter sp.]|uniref:capsular polysaccharide export protein, LipB/KpsS family n=1 Tax=Ferruginibacter sp. TaxID=1940288 RepID=UPI00265845C4|nr:hypothetical protein [Ferruginibacter sp.]